MIEMGAAMAVGCYPCMEKLTSVAADKGVSEAELGTIQAIVMAVSSGRVFNQYREVCKRLEGR
jgi:alkylhydroperoxidase/carboxymuconolactone decarboxylase family protein YurZ